MREGHECLCIDHSQSVGFFDHSWEKAESYNRVLTGELAFYKRQIQIFEQPVQLCRPRVIASVCCHFSDGNIGITSTIDIACSTVEVMRVGDDSGLCTFGEIIPAYWI